MADVWLPLPELIESFGLLGCDVVEMVLADQDSRLHDSRLQGYLLTDGERERAVELGAQVITAREADKMERQRAAVRERANCWYDSYRLRCSHE